MRDYYARRASEYEAIYRRDDPVRQTEQAQIASEMRALFAGRRVLEIACGTGYWTQFIADVAASIIGVDDAAETLEIARSKDLPADRVRFFVGDAYSCSDVPGDFDAGLANFWLSHVPRARMSEFLDGFHRRIGPGAVVFMADNVYVAGVGGELVTKPGLEDTFKIRRLSDGSTHEVLKNYYTAGVLETLLAPRADDLRIHVGACFWWASYLVAGSGNG